MSIRYPILAALISLIAGGCTHVEPNQPLKVDIGQNSPVHMQIYKDALSTEMNRILLLPPLGIANAETRSRFQQALYAAMQRRFTTPVGQVQENSAYAPYIQESNLLCNDNTINVNEVSIIGKLMGCSYVICPYVSELRPYPPQHIALRLIVIVPKTGRQCAELTAVIDAEKHDVFDYFVNYCKANGYGGNADDLQFKIHSPAAFQAFAADLCATVAEQKLESTVKAMQQQEQQQREIERQNELKREKQLEKEQQKKRAEEKKQKLRQQQKLEKEKQNELKKQKKLEQEKQKQLEKERQQRLKEQQKQKEEKRKALEKKILEKEKRKAEAILKQMEQIGLQTQMENKTTPRPSFTAVKHPTDKASK